MVSGYWIKFQCNFFSLVQIACQLSDVKLKVDSSFTELLSLDHQDNVIKWKHFLRYWPFVRGIHQTLVNSPHKVQWRGALMFSLICTLNKRLSKQLWGWWFEMPSRSLWRHCNGNGRRSLHISFLNEKIWVHFLDFFSRKVRMISANERRHYICSMFSHWLEPFSFDER